MKRLALLLLLSSLALAGCGGSAPAPCVPTTCSAQQKDCGSIDDGCGKKLECGTCTAPEVCGANNVCAQPGCTQSPCTLGSKQCLNDGVRECIALDDGCPGWGQTNACPAEQICSGGQCVTTCSNQCTENARQCSGTGVQTCKTMASGCTDWDTAVPCEGAQICSGGQCVTTCSNQCTLNATRCSSSALQTCKTMASGCTDWDTAVACSGPHEVCSGGVCTPTCADQCSLNEKRCAGTGIETCVVLGSGCTDWDTPVPCGVDEWCSNAQCVPAETCVDHLKNQDETDADCGGTHCPGCAIGKVCLANGDCLTNACDVGGTGTCVAAGAPTCSDVAKNRDESDVDCGGSYCA
ncbi:MAG: hypothetical protein HY901_09090, partial [Deltaproteobacteria bacterium]|nr:hypothetical protein [Deltaproteobacteria bacterium]